MGWPLQCLVCAEVQLGLMQCSAGRLLLADVGMVMAGCVVKECLWWQAC
jgi:hypothetical protein